MVDDEAVRILALPPSVANQSSGDALEDMAGYFDPDGVWLLATARAVAAHAKCRERFDCPIVHTALPRSPDAIRHDRLGGLDFVSVRNAPLLEDAKTSLTTGDFSTDPASTTWLVCPAIDVALDTTTLDCVLTHASKLFSLAQSIPEELVVLTASRPADYDVTWHLTAAGTVISTAHGLSVTESNDLSIAESNELSVAESNDISIAESDDLSVAESDSDTATGTTADIVTVRVHGIGPIEGYGNSSKIACLRLTSDGTIGTDVVNATAFGLRALEGIGQTIAHRLRERGIHTVEAVRSTPLRDLAAVPSMGRTGAEHVKIHAAVIETGEPVRLTDAALPGEGGGTPLCLDIETDSLSPTIVWQIGIYDPITDEYHSFVERTNPRDSKRVIEAFVVWYLANHQHRSLITWNGYRFDYPTLRRFIQRHVPAYADAWTDVSTDDLYDWAVVNGNALLPGRTNTLDTVATHCGYEFSGTGLDGQATAGAYQRFMRNPTEEHAPDWERHETYCEDDCRALWHVYETLQRASREPTTQHSASSSKQADLQEFS